MLSLTELELRFRNPQDRRIEGRFTATLPPNAAISRFAKDVNGHLMEGEVVERLRANQVYEQFLHQMRDPALLEQDQGNRFSARIFPIEAKAPVHLVLSYTALLPMRDGERTYSLPLRGIDKINKFSFRAFVTPIPGEGPRGKMTTSTAEVTSFDESDWTPDRDIVMTWRANEDTPATRVLRAGDFYLAAIRPERRNRQPPTANRQLALLRRHQRLVRRGRAASHPRARRDPRRAPRERSRASSSRSTRTSCRSRTARRPRSRARVGDLLRNRLFLGGTDVGALLRDVARNLRDESVARDRPRQRSRSDPRQHRAARGEGRDQRAPARHGPRADPRQPRRRADGEGRHRGTRPRRPRAVLRIARIARPRGRGRSAPPARRHVRRARRRRGVDLSRRTSTTCSRATK